MSISAPGFHSLFYQGRAANATAKPGQPALQLSGAIFSSFRIFSPFRRKPESMLAGSITIVGDYDAGFRRKPE